MSSPVRPGGPLVSGQPWGTPTCSIRSEGLSESPGPDLSSLGAEALQEPLPGYLFRRSRLLHPRHAPGPRSLLPRPRPGFFCSQPTPAPRLGQDHVSARLPVVVSGSRSSIHLQGCSRTTCLPRPGFAYNNMATGPRGLLSPAPDSALGSSPVLQTLAPAPGCLGLSVPSSAAPGFPTSTQDIPESDLRSRSTKRVRPPCWPPGHAPPPFIHF